MKHLLDPNVTAYAGMIAAGCAILAIGFTVRFMQLVRNEQPSRVYAFMAIGAVVVASHVLITVDAMRDHLAQQNAGTPLVLWLLAEAGLISLGMAAYYFKKHLGMIVVCATPFLAISALLAAYIASGAGASWASLLFDIFKYVALVPLVLAAVLRVIFPRRWHALPRQ